MSPQMYTTNVIYWTIQDDHCNIKMVCLLKVSNGDKKLKIWSRTDLKFQFSGEGFSSHWVPYWRQCTPCSFQFHMIGKLETGYDDFTVSFLSS